MRAEDRSEVARLNLCAYVDVSVSAPEYKFAQNIYFVKELI